MSEILKDLSLPFDLAMGEQIANEFGTPVHIYDQSGIEASADALQRGFAWNPDYVNYFAVKATPRPMILNVLRNKGMGFDCSSNAELRMMEQLGVPGDKIFYTSNNTPLEDFKLAIKLGATVNIDDLSQVPVFLVALGDQPFGRVALRYNPGKLKEGNEIIGKPEEAKYGMDAEQIIGAFAMLAKADIEQFGLHTMVASNERTTGYFAETASILLDAVDKVEEAGTTISFVNLGGGFGINYRPEEAPLDVERATSEIKDVFEARGRAGLAVFTENGRFVTGPNGYLLTRARYVMHKHKTYVGVDASMNNLMRPGMYDTYHHITVLGKEDHHANRTLDVVGSLCENNDKFAIDRFLPKIDEGDLLVIHDAGAHGSAMGFHYNGLLDATEVMIKRDGSVVLIRRPQTYEQLVQNEVWPV